MIMSETAASSAEVIQPSSGTISFINSNRGKPLLVANDYVFELIKAAVNTKYWTSTVNGCPAKVYTDLNSIDILSQSNLFVVRRLTLSSTINIPYHTLVGKILNSFYMKAMFSTFFHMYNILFDIFPANRRETGLKNVSTFVPWRENAKKYFYIRPVSRLV